MDKLSTVIKRIYIKFLIIKLKKMIDNIINHIQEG